MRREGQPETVVELPYRRLAAAVLVAAWGEATHRCTPRCFTERFEKRGRVLPPAAKAHEVTRRQARAFLLGEGMFAESLRHWTQLLDVHPDVLRVQLDRAKNGRLPRLEWPREVVPDETDADV